MPPERADATDAAIAPDAGFVIEPDPAAADVTALDPRSPILASLNTIWDPACFAIARRPLRVAALGEDERRMLSLPGCAPRVTDMPIKFPGSAFRVPAAFAQLRGLIQRVADVEARINAACFDEYYCYLSFDQGTVAAGKLQREGPCHVDGFQGARHRGKVRVNHSYVVSDALPTVFYAQPFDVARLDEARHNFFWEMNRQVAATNSEHAFRPEPYEVSLIDAYTVHRGDAAPAPTFRTWVRLSFEVRVFDRLGNTHNPLFRYAWPMVARDVERLGLVAFDEGCDPTLRVFPWQRPDGAAWGDPARSTQPNLRPRG